MTSLVTYEGLVELVRRGVIAGVDEANINAASIDVTLGPVLWVEDEAPQEGLVDLAAKGTPAMDRVGIPDDGYPLRPGQFVLAQTREVFHLPAYLACEFRLKSSGARAGLDQALAVWCDPGWHGSVLTLELRNNLSHHALLLRPGMKIGQMVCWLGDAVPRERSYAAMGQYNGDLESQPSRGIR